jgi:transcriptional/translational regulatory protein YebC/TACO1
MFKKKGLFIVEKSTGVNEDDLMMISLDAGAEDFKSDDEEFEIITSPEDFEAVQEALNKNNITLSMAQITMIPETG